MTDTPKSPLLRLADFLATGFYSGRSPIMPGTVGTITAMVFVYLLYQLSPGLTSLSSTAVLATITAILGIICSNALCTSNFYGDSLKDPQQIVIDEFAGYYVAIIGLQGEPLSLGIAFIFFRFFDMLKPPPIRQVERLPLGWGIMADDLLAGVFAGVCTHLTLNYLC